MNDFFSSLAVRATAAEPAIAPRRASRFETPGEGSGAPVRDVGGPVPETRGDGAAPIAAPNGAAADAPAASAPGVSPLRPAADAFDDAPERRAAAPPVRGDDSAERSPPLAPPSPAITTVTHLHAHTTTVETRPVPPPFSPATRDDEAILRPMPVAPVAEAASGREVSEPRVRARDDSPASGRATLSPAIERLVPSVPRDPAPEPARSFDPAVHESAAPRIEITIGTVEVRALVAPPPPAAAPRAVRDGPRQPSLDDYLRNRRSPRA